MSSDERSPKRQRLSSYSPASTPTDTKTTPGVFVQHPQTPPPSVHMSPSWHSTQQLPGLGMAGGSNPSGGVNFPTPPSPAQGQSVTQSEGGSAQQTPAGESERQDAEMGDVSMADGDDSGHRRTDHEREGAEAEVEAADSVSSLPGPVPLYKLGIQRKYFRPHASSCEP